MKILILGSAGLLGSYVLSIGKISGFDVVGISRKKNRGFDFNYESSIFSIIDTFQPNVVINCVAITSFDFCEEHFEEALKINCSTPVKIAEKCAELNIKFVHISTDHYYNGNGKRQHEESDKVTILNKYAQTKYLAEEGIKTFSNCLILRTSIIGRTSNGRNFLDWIINALQNGDRVGLYEDAFTSFIHCNQLSKIIFELLLKNASGLYNIGASEVFSKAEFCILLAKEIELNLNYFLTKVTEQRIQRANSCGLSSKLIQDRYTISIPTMEDVVSQCVIEWSTSSKK